jgi:hypothetical protein
MNAMAPAFQGLVSSVLEACIYSYEANTIIMKVLKILYLSPFCKGGWDTVGVNGTKVKWPLEPLDEDDQ